MGPGVLVSLDFSGSPLAKYRGSHTVSSPAWGARAEGSACGHGARQTPTRPTSLGPWLASFCPSPSLHGVTPLPVPILLRKKLKLGGEMTSSGSGEKGQRQDWHPSCLPSHAASSHPQPPPSHQNRQMHSDSPKVPGPIPPESRRSHAAASQELLKVPRLAHCAVRHPR
jgi:hypothetical protein